MTFKGLFQLKLFSDSMIFLHADQGYVPTLQSVVWKGVEQWWPRAEGGLKVWRWEGCQNKEALTPFYYNCWGRQVKGYFFTASWRPLDHSVQNALKLLSFGVFVIAAPLQQRPFPLAIHTVLLLTKGAGELLFSCGCLQYHGHCHNITVPTPDFWV